MWETQDDISLFPFRGCLHSTVFLLNGRCETRLEIFFFIHGDRQRAAAEEKNFVGIKNVLPPLLLSSFQDGFFEQNLSPFTKGEREREREREGYF